jgi:hypothetical protein
MVNFLKNVDKAVTYGDRAGKKGKRAVRQAVKRGGKQVFRAGTAAATGNAAGVAKAFVE